MTTLEEILKEIEEMKYPIEGIGCGLEDVGITDRYEAAEYGWNEAVEMVSDIVKNHLSDLDNDGWIPVEERLPEETGRYNVTFRSDESVHEIGYGSCRADVFGTQIGYGWYDLYSAMYFSDDAILAWRPLPEHYRKDCD